MSDNAAVGKFERSSAGGFFTVTNHPSPGIVPNVVPPARVTDLRFIRASEEDLTVELQWTAVGSDLYEGTGRPLIAVLSYKLKYIIFKFQNLY